MKGTLLVPFLLLILIPFSAGAQTPPWSGIIAPSRAENWSGAGVPGGIPSGSWVQCGSTISAGASAATINAAIAACPANHYVLLGAGTFNLTAGLVWNHVSNVVLRGAGANQTFLVFTADNPCQGGFSAICFESSDLNYNMQPSNLANWTSGYSVGATSITVSSATNLAVGWPVTLDETDDPSTSDTGAIFVCYTPQGVCSTNGDNAGGARAGRSQQQMVTVTSISGSGPYTVGISPPIIMPNWVSTKTPQAWWPTGPVFNDGVEDLSLDGTNSGDQTNVEIFNCVGCWVKGVTSILPNRSHVQIWQSSHASVVNNYFFLTGYTASVHYGVETIPSSDSLIQNNIFEQVQAPYVTNGACTGCVLSYNFDVNNVFGTPFTWLSASGYPHAVGDEHMLYEGNMGAGIYSDNFHGTHQLITIFRNAYNGFQQDNATLPTGGLGPLVINAYSRFYNVIGNVIGSPALPFNTYEDTVTDPHTSSNAIYSVGYGDEIPNDSNTATTLMRWGNYDSVTATSRFVSTEVPSGLTGAQASLSNPVPASNNLPASFYLSTEPSWWPSSKPWPAVGPDVSAGNVSICSGGTYNGAYVTSIGECSGGSLTTMGGHINSNPAMDCYYSMGGSPIGMGAVLSFNESACYGQTVAVQPPQPPTNLTATVE
jgi:hypothetical protein